MPLVAAGLVALAIVYFAWRSRSAYMNLPSLQVGISVTREDHCIIIPARNEEKAIARAVRSFEGSLTLVVDDLSADRTAEIAASAGAQVRQALPLKPRSFGKPNACRTGAGLTESKWILFADADTWYEAGFLPSLLEYAASNGLHVATILPRLEMETWWERAMVPYAFGLYFTGVDARSVNDPKKPDALANGQCFLWLRAAYDFLGGHGAVACSAIGELALARLVKRHRMNIRVLRCETHARARMFDSFHSLWHRFARHTIRFLRANPKSGAWAAAASIVMSAWLPVLVWLWAEGYNLAAICFLAAPTLAWLPWYGSVRHAVLAPLAIYLFQAMAALGIARHVLGLSVTWKARRI